MAKEKEKILAEGSVVEALPSTQFKVRLDNGHEVLAHISQEAEQIHTADPVEIVHHLGSAIPGIKINKL